MSLTTILLGPSGLRLHVTRHTLVTCTELNFFSTPILTGTKLYHINEESVHNRNITSFMEDEKWLYDIVF